MFNLKNSIIAASILGLSMIPSKVEMPLQTKAFAQERLEDKVISVKIKDKVYKVDKDYIVTRNEKSVGDEEELLKVVELAKLVEEARKIQDYRIDFFGLWDLEALKYSAFVRRGQALTIKYDDHIKWALSFPIKFLEHALSGTLDIPKESKGYILIGMKKFLENPQENLKNYSFMLYNDSNQRLEENASLIRKISKSGFIDEETAIKIKDNSDYAEIFGNAALEYYKELQKYDTLEKRWFIELIPGIKDMIEREYEKLPKEAIVYLEKAFLSKLKNYPPNKKFEELIETNRNNLIRKKSNYLVNLKNFIDEKLFGSPEIVLKNLLGNRLCNMEFDNIVKMYIAEARGYVSKLWKKVDEASQLNIKGNSNIINLWKKEVCDIKYQILHQEVYKNYSIIIYKISKDNNKTLFLNFFRKDSSRWELLPQFNNDLVAGVLDESEFEKLKGEWRKEIEEYYSNIIKKLRGEEDREKEIKER